MLEYLEEIGRLFDKLEDEMWTEKKEENDNE